MATQTRTKPQIAVMNAVHDLPVLVARDEGYFRDEGLDLEFVTTPGMAQVTTSHFVKFDSVFDRPLDSVYNEGGIDQYRMCEWGIMKRAVEAGLCRQVLSFQDLSLVFGMLGGSLRGETAQQRKKLARRALQIIWHGLAD